MVDDALRLQLAAASVCALQVLASPKLLYEVGSQLPATISAAEREEYLKLRRLADSRRPLPVAAAPQGHYQQARPAGRPDRVSLVADAGSEVSLTLVQGMHLPGVSKFGLSRATLEPRILIEYTHGQRAEHSHGRADLNPFFTHTPAKFSIVKTFNDETSMVEPYGKIVVSLWDVNKYNPMAPHKYIAEGELDFVATSLHEAKALAKKQLDPTFTPPPGWERQFQEGEAWVTLMPKKENGRPIPLNDSRLQSHFDEHGNLGQIKVTWRHNMKMAQAAPRQTFAPQMATAMRLKLGVPALALCGLLHWGLTKGTAKHRKYLATAMGLVNLGAVYYGLRISPPWMVSLWQWQGSDRTWNDFSEQDSQTLEEEWRRGSAVTSSEASLVGSALVIRFEKSALTLKYPQPTLDKLNHNVRRVAFEGSPLVKKLSKGVSLLAGYTFLTTASA